MWGSTMLRWLAVAALLFSVLLYLLYLPFSGAAAERFPTPAGWPDSWGRSQGWPR